MVRESITPAATVIVVLSIGDLRYLLFIPRRSQATKREIGRRAAVFNASLSASAGLRWGQGGENLPDSMSSGETRSDTSQQLYGATRTPSLPFCVSRSLVRDRSVAERSGVANLAYWVTGTEGSNLSLSANESPISENLRRIARNCRVCGGSMPQAGLEKSTLCPASRDWRNSSPFRIRALPRDESSGSDPIYMRPVDDPVPRR